MVVVGAAVILSVHFFWKTKGILELRTMPLQAGKEWLPHYNYRLLLEKKYDLEKG